MTRVDNMDVDGEYFSHEKMIRTKGRKPYAVTKRVRTSKDKERKKLREDKTRAREW